MRYPGGKGTCFQQIINLMPPHQVYVETHAGGGAVLRNKRPARHNIALEIDEEAYWKLAELQKDDPYLTVLNHDALIFLNGLQVTDKVLIYADPPYLMSTRKGRSLYKHEYTEDQHIELLSLLKTMRPAKVMISGYWSELYEDMLFGWNQYQFDVMTRGGLATEYLWFNYPWPDKLHDYSHLGSTFRERERIKRKQKRWIANLKRMSALERNALIELIKEGNYDQI